MSYINYWKREYEELVHRRKLIKEEKKELEGNEYVKRYLELIKKDKILLKSEHEYYSAIKNYEYKNCEHVLVFCKVSEDLRGRIFKNCGCIKCGLDESVLNKNKEDLTFKESIMERYLKMNQSYLSGKKIYVQCDLSLACSIYSKIKQKYPNINDVTATKYFERALAHIRKKQVSEDRRIKRAKRLSLKPGFDNWYSEDVFKNKND